MKRLVLAVLAVFAGCKPPPPPPDCPPTRAFQNELPLLEPGVSYRGVIRSPAVPLCDGGNVSFSASMLDGNNQAVENVTWTLTREPANSLGVELAFVPAAPGPYHVTVRFEPSLSTVQEDIVQGTRRARPVLQTLALPPGIQCRVGHLTSRGTLVCAVFASSVFAIRDGHAREIGMGGFCSAAAGCNSVTHVAFGGDAVWLSAGDLLTEKGRVERWVELDADAGFVRVPDVTLEDTVVVRAATETQGFGGERFGRLVKLTIDRGAWASPESFAVPQQLSDARNLAVAVSPASLSRDAGFWWWASDAWCRNPVGPDGGQRCFSSKGLSHFVEPDGVWFQIRPQGNSRELGFLDEQGRSVTVPGPQGTTEVAPVLLDDGRIAYLSRESDGGLTFELIDGGYTGGWVEGDRLYLAAPGSVTVLQR